jgi:hypothetical protein
MIILIILGLLQALILPGLICSYYLKNINFADRILLASTLSLISNYVIVWCLYLLGIYSQTSLLVLIAVELLLLFKLRSSFRADLKQAAQCVYTFIVNAIKTKAISAYGLFFILFCIYYFYLLKTNGFLTVFTHWDAVVSWNRWAVELYEGTFQGSRGYPLAVPILFSIIYGISNETNVQTLAKYICVYWPFLGGVALFCCGLHVPKIKNVFAVSSFFYLYLLSKGSYTVDFIFSGLMDPFMAAFGAIFIHHALWVTAQQNIERLEYKKIVALGLLSIAGGALVKMTGIVLLFDFIVVTGCLIFYDKQLQQHKRYFLLFFFGVLVLAIHWYALTTFYLRDWQPISEYNSLQDPRIWLRPYLHFVLFGSTFGWLFVGLVLSGLFYSKRTCVLFVLLLLPLFIFCGIVVGYDLRATFILFAPISILAALGLSLIGKSFAQLYGGLITAITSRSRPSAYVNLAIVVAVVTVLLGGLTVTMSRDKILSSNTEKRIAANDFAEGGNKRLLQIFEAEPKARILSCWQTPVGLPGAKGRFIPSGDCTVTLLQGWLADAGTKYWLYRDEGSPTQLLMPAVVAQVLAQSPVTIHAEPLGSGFTLYSK